MISATHSEPDLDYGIDKFVQVGKQLKVV